MLQEESAAYTTINTEQELIQQHFRPGDEFMTVTAICSHLRESTGVPVNANNISREMKKLGDARLISVGFRQASDFFFSQGEGSRP